MLVIAFVCRFRLRRILPRWSQCSISCPRLSINFTEQNSCSPMHRRWLCRLQSVNYSASILLVVDRKGMWFDKNLLFWEAIYAECLFLRMYIFITFPNPVGFVSCFHCSFFCIINIYRFLYSSVALRAGKKLLGNMLQKLNCIFSWVTVI